MNLGDAQRAAVSQWIRDGLKLSEIQNRIASEFGARLTYMDVRLLVDDLKLTPRDPEPPQVPAGAAAAKPVPDSLNATPPEPSTGTTPLPGASVSVDQLARPGAVVSGRVTFSDGQEATWYFDQTGRLGLSPKLAGYRPSPEDLRHFQSALEAELSRLGM